MDFFGNILSGDVDAVSWLDNPFNNDAESQTTTYKQDAAAASYWKGSDGNLYWTDPQNGYAVTNLGNYDQYPYKSMLGSEISDPNPGGATSTGTALPSSNTSSGSYTGGVAAPKVLDTAQLNSLDSLLASLDAIRNQAREKATIRRDTSKREKEEERTREEGKYKGKKLDTLQDFGSAKTDTDLNTRNTLENLVSSLSTLGLGGSRELTRQILAAANVSNRKANATQATNNRDLDSSWNEFAVGNENDVKKINDQFGYDTGEADRKWGQDRQNTLYKKADVYNAADMAAERQAIMGEAAGLNDFVARAPFINPSYTGASRAMATPELADYTQDIATYDTTSVGADATGLTPVGAGVTPGTTPGNLAVKAIAVNDKDLGIKKKTEADLGYGI